MKRIIAIFDDGTAFICDNANDYNSLLSLKGTPLKTFNETGYAFSNDYRKIDPRKDLGRIAFNVIGHNSTVELGIITDITTTKSLKHNGVTEYIESKTSYTVDNVNYYEEICTLVVKEN